MDEKGPCFQADVCRATPVVGHFQLLPAFDWLTGEIDSRQSHIIGKLDREGGIRFGLLYQFLLGGQLFLRIGFQLHNIAQSGVIARIDFEHLVQ